MTSKRSGADRQAAARATARLRAQERAVAAAETTVRRTSDDLAALEEQADALRARRDRALVELRKAGYSWGRLAGLAGTTRNAVKKRVEERHAGMQ